MHFMRNILAHVGQREKQKVATKLKGIWQATTKEDGRNLRRMPSDREYRKKFPQAFKCLEEGFEDSVQFYAFDKIDPEENFKYECN